MNSHPTPQKCIAITDCLGYIGADGRCEKCHTTPDTPKVGGTPDWTTIFSEAVGPDATQVGEWQTGGGCTALGAAINVGGMDLHVTVTSSGDASAPTSDDDTVSLQVADCSERGYNEGRWVGTDDVRPADLQRLIGLLAQYTAHQNPTEVWLDPEQVRVMLDA